MKKALKITGIALGVILIIMIVLPFAFKGKINEKIKEVINESVNAKVDYKDYSLGLFRSFPNFNFGIEGLSIVGKDKFAGDTLAYLGNLRLKIDLLSVFKGENYEIKSIVIENSKINAIYSKDGFANWDIMIPDSSATPEAAKESSPFKLTLDKILIVNSDVAYIDRQSDMSAHLKQMNFEINGNMVDAVTNLVLSGDVKALTFNYEGVDFLKDVQTKLVADLSANLDSFSFVFKENEFSLNDLKVKFDGWVKMPYDDIDMDIKYSSKDNDFKSILSLVPSMYTADFASIKTSGKASVNGWLKGVYNDVSMPAFGVNLKVDNGKFQYPDLPKSVDNINVLVDIISPSSDFDKMRIDVAKFHFEVAKNPFDIKLKLRTPMSDPDIDASFVGKLNLSDVKSFYPLGDTIKIGGLLNSNIALKGKQSFIDAGKYDQFIATGGMTLKDFNYVDADFAEGLNISSADLQFNPKSINLNQFLFKYKQNTISATGDVSNYIDYFVSDGMLKGGLKISTEYLNVNDFMSASTSSPEANTADTVVSASFEPIEIPSNLDLGLEVVFGKLIYDNIEMTSVYGKAGISNSKLVLNDLNMKLLDGAMSMSGYFSTADVAKPEANLMLNLSNVNVKKSYETFMTVKKYAPIAQFIDGKVSMLLNFTSSLTQNFDPIYNTLDAKGMILGDKLTLKGSPVMNKFADLLKYSGVKELISGPLAAAIEIVDGNLEVKPFNFMVNGMKSTVGGKTGIDQNIAYDFKLEMPKEKLGAAANAVANNLTAQAASVGVDIKTSETIVVNTTFTEKITDPKIGLKVENPIQNDVKAEVKEMITEKVEDLKKQAEAEAEKLKKEMQDKANAELEKQKAELAKQKAELERKAQEEKEKAKKKLEEEAKNKLKGLIKK